MTQRKFTTHENIFNSMTFPLMNALSIDVNKLQEHAQKELGRKLTQDEIKQIKKEYAQIVKEIMEEIKEGISKL